MGARWPGVRHSGRMRRRTLPLLIAVLLASSGCVSVAPADDKPPRTPAGIAVPTSAPALATDRPVQERALPLSALPSQPVPASVAAPAAVAAATAEEKPAARPRKVSRPVQQRNRLQPRVGVERKKTSSAKPKRPRSAAGVPQAKPRAKKVRPPVPPMPRRSQPGRVPPGKLDMAELCRASHGVTSPAITQLCGSSIR